MKSLQVDWTEMLSKFYFKYKSNRFGYILLKTILLIVSFIPIILLIILNFVFLPFLLIEAVLVGLSNARAVFPEDRIQGGLFYWLTILIGWMITLFIIIGCLPDRDPSIFQKYF
jgi:hypothetical protein